MLNKAKKEGVKTFLFRLSGSDRDQRAQLYGLERLLEVESNSKLHCSRSIALSRQRAKAGRIARVSVVARTGIEEVDVVQNVDENDARLEVEALRELDLFRHAEIKAPIRQAPDDAPAAVTGVEAKNWLTDAVVHSLRVGEQVETKARGTYTCPYQKLHAC